MMILYSSLDPPCGSQRPEAKLEQLLVFQAFSLMICVAHGVLNIKMLLC